MAPVGLVFSDPFSLGSEFAAITHGHPTGYLAAGAFAFLIAHMFRGATLRDAIKETIEVLTQQEGQLGQENVSAIRKALELANSEDPSPETVQCLGAGWVAEEALAIGLYCALVAKDFRSGVLLAVNHGGDSDSTGSIAGNLLSLIHGIADIPQDWAENLDARQVVEQVADDLHTRFVEGRALDHKRYPPN